VSGFEGPPARLKFEGRSYMLDADKRQAFRGVEVVRADEAPQDDANSYRGFNTRRDKARNRGRIMELLFAILALAAGWVVWSLIDLRRLRKRLEEIDHDRERFGKGGK
jgi:hypothetical protein